jgi:hypothetical protein
MLIGSCIFGKKALTIEQTGATIAIIVNSAPYNLVLLMSTSSDVKIPTFMIGQQDGQIILDALKIPDTIVIITMKTTGPCRKEEADALRTIVRESNWSKQDLYGYGSLRWVEDLLTDATLDPCEGVIGKYIHTNTKKYHISVSLLSFS